jgi:redox-sensing transcriptional repressor
MPSERSRRRIPDATVARLPIYLRLLSEQADDGVESISSDRLAELGGVNAAKVRKDLSYLGSYGTRGVGYEVAYLVYQIRRELGLTHDWPVVIVGAGNLGQALAGYGGFGERGFPVAGVVDIDDGKVGSVLGGVRVRHIDDLPQIVQAKRVRIGVVATPGASAQDAADRLVAAGITSILNFAPVVLSVPHSIEVRKVDLAVELQILSYYEQRRAGGAIHAMNGSMTAAAGPHRSASA